MAPNKKETQTESFKRSLRRTLLNFWERGIFFCLVGFDWAKTVATITSNSQLSQPKPARHAVYFCAKVYHYSDFFSLFFFGRRRLKRRSEKTEVARSKRKH